MDKLPLFLALSIILASCSAESASSDANTSPAVTSPETGETAGLQSIRSQETKVLLAQEPDILVLDVRTPEEYAAGHLKGAQQINFYSPDFFAAGTGFRSGQNLPGILCGGWQKQRGSTDDGQAGV
jgi:phage shock protein E